MSTRDIEVTTSAASFLALELFSFYWRRRVGCLVFVRTRVDRFPVGQGTKGMPFTLLQALGDGAYTSVSSCSP